MISKNQTSLSKTNTKKATIKSKAKSPKIKPFAFAAEQTKNKSHPKTSNKSANHWDKIFDSVLPDGMKDGMQKFIKGSNNSFSSADATENSSVNIAKNMVMKLSNTLRNNFEQNVELGQETLKCRTASDLIEFQRKSFEVNYKNAVKIYSDFIHDLQNLSTESLKDIRNCASKGATHL